MPGHEPAPTAAVPFQPMGPGAILGAAFGSYRRRWPTLLAVMAVAVPIAVSVPSTRVMPGPGGEYRVVLHHRVVATGGSWAATAIVTLAMLAGVLALTVVAGAVTRAAAAAVAGEDLGVAPSYRFGIGRTWPLLGVLLTTWLCTVLGAVLLIVPGVVVGVLLAVAVPALVVEGLGARAALSRSLELVRGQWWHAFGTILLTWLLLGLAVNLVLNAVGGFGHGWLARTAAQALAILLATPYAALVGVLLHLDLRARKEPPGAELVRPELGASGT
jgi:hypothetical protein